MFPEPGHQDDPGPLECAASKTETAYHPVVHAQFNVIFVSCPEMGVDAKSETHFLNGIPIVRGRFSVDFEQAHKNGPTKIASYTRDRPLFLRLCHTQLYECACAI